MWVFVTVVPHLVMVESLTANWTQLTEPIPRPVEEAYGRVPERLVKSSRDAQNVSAEFKRVRLPDNCIFPIDLVIVQDATASFEDDYVEMRNRQLKLIVDGVTASHPGTRIGLASFKDKPIWTLGDSTDYCYLENLPLQTANYTALYNAYEVLESFGGADPAENQLGALVAAAQSKTIGWGGNPLATNLIILATDAWFHYDLDGLNTYGMTPFTGVTDFANDKAQCLSQYYPSPAQTVRALTSINSYVGFLLSDPDWAAGRPYTAWKWFNEYIGQTDDFITNSTASSADFWDNLAKVIAVVERDECDGSTTSSPTTPSPSPTTGATTTITPRTVSQTSVPTSTIAPGTLPTATESLTTLSGYSTACPNGICPCPEVLIQLRQRPEQLNLDVENSV